MASTCDLHGAETWARDAGFEFKLTDDWTKPEPTSALHPFETVKPTARVTVTTGASRPGLCENALCARIPW
jgi:hypothetical protein